MGARNIGHRMSIALEKKKSNFGNQQCLRFHIWFIMILYYKMRQTLLQNATASLLQNVTTVHYKMYQLLCYNMRHLLQNVSILLQNATVVTKYV